MPVVHGTGADLRLGERVSAAPGLPRVQGNWNHAPGGPRDPARPPPRRRAADCGRHDRSLARWRAWFPNEDSIVDVPRRDLLLLVEAARQNLAQEAAVAGLVAAAEAVVTDQFVRADGEPHVDDLMDNLRAALAAVAGPGEATPEPGR